MSACRFHAAGIFLLLLIVVNTAASEPLVSIDAVGADVRNVYSEIGEQAGYNVVIHPLVKGAITVKLEDVPWRKALEVVLEILGHEARIDGNTIFIAPMGKLR